MVALHYLKIYAHQPSARELWRIGGESLLAALSGQQFFINIVADRTVEHDALAAALGEAGPSRCSLDYRDGDQAGAPFSRALELLFDRPSTKAFAFPLTRVSIILPGAAG